MPAIVIAAKVAAVLYVLAIVAMIPYLATSERSSAARARRFLRIP